MTLSRLVAQVMNAAHLHLALNHLPVVGSLFVVLLLGWALFRRSDELLRTALGGIVLVTMLCFPAYFTGEPAEELVRNIPGITAEPVKAHEEAAEKAFTVLFVVGVAALGVLVWRRRQPIPRWVGGSLLAALIAAGTMLGWTANLGGKIRHPEITAERTAGN